MRFAIIGAGAIGAYLGAAIARGGSDVVLIARGPNLAAIRRKGVTVRGDKGEFHADVEGTDEIAAVAGADVVILAVKSYSMSEVAPPLGRYLSRTGIVMGIQNGLPWWYFQGVGGELDGLRLEAVDPGGLIARALPACQTIGCVVRCSTELAEPGVVRQVGGSYLPIGEPDGSLSQRCRAVSERLKAGGLIAPVYRDIRTHIWRKAIVNVPFNAVTALTGATLGELGDLPMTRCLLRASMQECVDVAARLGIALSGSIDRSLEAGIAVGNHKTSMLQDLEAGKPLEIASLSGAVLELAAKVDVPMPITQAIHTCIELRTLVRERQREQGRVMDAAPTLATAAIREVSRTTGDGFVKPSDDCDH